MDCVKRTYVKFFDNSQQNKNTRIHVCHLMKGLFYLGIFREVCDKLPRYYAEGSFLNLAFSLGC